jgi:hypothetical protein
MQSFLAKRLQETFGVVSSFINAKKLAPIRMFFLIKVFQSRIWFALHNLL